VCNNNLTICGQDYFISKKATPTSDRQCQAINCTEGQFWDAATDGSATVNACTDIVDACQQGHFWSGVTNGSAHGANCTACAKLNGCLHVSCSNATNSACVQCSHSQYLNATLDCIDITCEANTFWNSSDSGTALVTDLTTQGCLAIQCLQGEFWNGPTNGSAVGSQCEAIVCKDMQFWDYKDDGLAVESHCSDIAGKCQHGQFWSGAVNGTAVGNHCAEIKCPPNYFWNGPTNGTALNLDACQALDCPPGLMWSGAVNGAALGPVCSECGQVQNCIQSDCTLKGPICRSCEAGFLLNGQSGSCQSGSNSQAASATSTNVIVEAVCLVVGMLLVVIAGLIYWRRRVWRQKQLSKALRDFLGTTAPVEQDSANETTCMFEYTTPSSSTNALLSDAPNEYWETDYTQPAPPQTTTAAMPDDVARGLPPTAGEYTEYNHTYVYTSQPGALVEYAEADLEYVTQFQGLASAESVQEPDTRCVADQQTSPVPLEYAEIGFVSTDEPQYAVLSRMKEL